MFKEVKDLNIYAKRYRDKIPMPMIINFVKFETRNLPNLDIELNIKVKRI